MKTEYDYLISLYRFFWKERLLRKMRIDFFHYDTRICGIFHPKAFNRNNGTIQFLRKSNKICQWMTLLEIKWQLKYTIFGYKR
jgi:hypothetical protein